MQYVSTRGEAPALGFSDAVLAGLARDGGLYVPREWPRFSTSEIRAMRAELAALKGGVPSGPIFAAKAPLPFLTDAARCGKCRTNSSINAS